MGTSWNAGPSPQARKKGCKLMAGKMIMEKTAKQGRPLARENFHASFILVARSGLIMACLRGVGCSCWQVIAGLFSSIYFG